MDSSSIVNLVYRCAELLNCGETELAAGLFAHARVQLEPDGEFLGQRQLQSAWLEQASTGERLIHNPIVEVDQAKDTAICRSRYTLIQPGLSMQWRVAETGIYSDEFERVGGEWRFSQRRCQVLDVSDDGNRKNLRKVAAEGAGAAPERAVEMSPAKQKIITAAQQIFSTVGYSEAGIRKIADLVGLSPTILFRHFGTKAGLFEAALIDAMGPPRPPVSRDKFGEHVANLLADPNQVNCPHAMTILATGNEEAREIAIRVLKEYAVDPMLEWLGSDHRESRAREIMALCAGFALYNVQLNMDQQRKVDPHMVNWLAKSIQAVVDEAG